MSLPVAVSFGIAVPQEVREGREPLPDVARFARAAERLGYDGLWALDRIQGHQSVLEPLVLLTAAAAVTRRIRLGVAVIILPLRSPVELARTTASLDRLSGGRLDLGVGLGVDRERVGAVGLDPARRAARMTDSIAVIRGLWTGERASVDGATLSIRDWMIRPTPAQRPGPPIWFGGHHPDALRRAVALGDGWLGAGSVSMEDFGREIAFVREELARAGRPEAGFGLGKRLYLALDDRRGSRRPALRRWLADHYRDPEKAEKVAAMGPATAIVDAALQIVDQGGRLVIFHPVTDEERQMREIAAEVLPAIRAALAVRGSADDGGPG